MAEQILMLALSPTMEKGVITKWLKKVGDKVKSGEVICEVETDKATMEYESQAEGVLQKIVVPENGQAAIGDCIAIIGQEGEHAAEIPAGKPAAAMPVKAGLAGVAKPAEPEKLKESVSVQAVETGGTEQIKSSPLARKIASQHGLNIHLLTGTGPGGRVVLRDVEQAIAAGRKPAAVISKAAVAEAVLKDEEIPVAGKRKIIAQRLSESMFSAPHFYLKVAVDAGELVRTRQKLNLDPARTISINAFLIKLTAETLKHHPVVNSSWAGDRIIRHGRIDIGLAVALEDGLIVPAVRDCANKGIMAIEAELTELIGLAKAGKLKKEHYGNATFTISNLGSFGVDEFTAIINPPESAILAVGRIRKVPVFDEKGNVAAASMMNMTLGCDHRVIDGAVGARFLSDLKQLIESPISAFY